MDKQYTFIDAFDGEFLTEIGDDLYKFTDAIPPIEVRTYIIHLRLLLNINDKEEKHIIFKYWGNKCL